MIFGLPQQPDSMISHLFPATATSRKSTTCVGNNGRTNEQFGHDPKKLCEHYMKLQERHRDRLPRATDPPHWQRFLTPMGKTTSDSSCVRKRFFSGCQIACIGGFVVIGGCWIIGYIG